MDRVFPWIIFALAWTGGFLLGFALTDLGAPDPATCPSPPHAQADDREPEREAG